MAKVDVRLDLGGFQIGGKYTKARVADVGGMEVPETIFGTPWSEGIVEFDNAVVLFATFQETSSSSYKNYFDGDLFWWQSQNRHNQSSALIKLIHGQMKPVHLFARIEPKIGGKGAPFIYCGRLGASQVEGANPVGFLFDVPEYQEQPSPDLARIYQWRPDQVSDDQVRRQKAIDPELAERGRVERAARLERRRAKYWRVEDAVRALGVASVADIRQWIAKNHPSEMPKSLQADVYFLTVNSASRPSYDRSRNNWRSDSGNVRDKIYRFKRGNKTVYELFDPIKHGHFDLRHVDGSTWEVVKIETSSLEQAEIVGRSEEDASVKQDPVSEEDSRKKVMREIARRQGQGKFRQLLLDVYNSACAVTGVSSVQVLEAAHIKPYMGEHSNRADNGLLLRADVHTLFDLGLIWIDDSMKVCVASNLRGSEYGQWHESPLRLPEFFGDRPHPDHLRHHRVFAEERELKSLTGVVIS